MAAFRKIPEDVATLRCRLTRTKQVENYFATEKSPKLHIGCGKNVLAGWLNCDYTPFSERVVYLDAAAPFPFANASFDFIFSEHMIAHIPYAAGQQMLRECFRVLKPGGTIRISTPDLRNIASLMFEPATPEKQSYIKMATDRYIPENTRYLAGFVVNNFYWDFLSYFIYDSDTLKNAFESAGFRQIRQMTSGIGSVPELDNLECHAKNVDSRLDEFESMIFEACK